MSASLCKKDRKIKKSGRRPRREETATTHRWCKCGEVGVIDGLLSGVVNILKIGYIKSVDFSPTLQAERMKSQAFDKAGPPFLLIYTHIP